MSDEDAKAEVEVGKDDKADEVAKTPEKEKPTAEVVTPNLKEGEGGKEPSVKLEQRLSTVEGMLKKSQERVNQLEGESRNFEGLRTQIEPQEGTLNLVIDTLSALAGDKEDVQERVKKSREEKETSSKKAKVYAEIMTIATEGGLAHDSPELEPVKQAFIKGDYEGAKTQVFLTVLGKVKDGKVVKATEEPAEKESEKKKLPVNTGSHAPAQDWREKSSKDKITEALDEKRAQS